MKISIILPIFHEDFPKPTSDYIKKIGDFFSRALLYFKNLELICVDENSTPEVLNFLKQIGFMVENISASNRAQRINLGLQKCTGDIMLIHHPRTLLSMEALEALEALGKTKKFSGWGGFTHRFDFAHPLLDFTSWYSNTQRFDHRALVYFDHCVFLSRDFFQKFPIQNFVPLKDIFEDTALSEKLRKKSWPLRLPYLVTTSAIRFQQNGLIRQSLLNQILKWAYWFKFSDKTINKIYEKGLSLNSKY
jgi:glycosyltransferase involved in cell wall biosynthesis